MVMSTVRRLGIFFGTFVAASIVIFALLSILPGNAARIALGINATEEQVAVQAQLMGLDRPIVVRYLDWFGHLLIGDFGISAVSGQPIGPQIMSALSVSALLALTAILVALIIAVPLGVWAAIRHRNADGVAIAAASQVGIAIPAFLAGMLLVAVFAVTLRWLPASGWVSPSENLGLFFRHLILPAVALGGIQGAILSRYVRSSVLEIMREDFLRTARAKGLTRHLALFRHGLRNAAVPVVTVLGLQIASLLAGTVVIERVFAIPGVGSLLIENVSNRDLPVVQGIVMVIVTMVLLVNLLVDIVHTIIDPRLRSAS